MRPIWLGTKPPLNQSAPSPPRAMLPPSSAGLMPAMPAGNWVRTGSFGPAGGAGAGGGGAGVGEGAGAGGGGVSDESTTVLPVNFDVLAPPPHAVKLAARAITSRCRVDQSIIRVSLCNPPVAAAFMPRGKPGGKRRNAAPDQAKSPAGSGRRAENCQS